MGVHVEWFDEEQTIVLYVFAGRWTWDEFYPVYETGIAMETAVSHRVDIILDVQKSHAIPPNVIFHLKHITDRQPPNVYLNMLITENKVMHAVFRTAIRFYPRIGEYFSFAPNYESALNAIHEARRLATSQE
ncbi:MAG: hypothetical protein ACOCX3_02065 [Chloroflexota bacterium]